MIEITPQEKAIVLNILNRYLPGRRVCAFGSRITGQAKPYSDLDLAIMDGRPLDFATMAQIKDAFAESDLPYRVDLLEWYNTRPEFRETVQPQLEPLN